MTTSAEQNTLAAFIAGHLSRPRSLALAERRGGRTIALSAADVQQAAAGVSHALRSHAIGRGDRVAIFAANRFEWLLADFGILYAGAVVVPIFATAAGDQLAFILRDSGARLVFVDDAPAAARVRAALGASVLPIVAFDSPSDGATAGPDDTLAFDAFVAAGNGRDDDAEIRAYREGIGADDMAVLIYTSGTTGDPKGVMLSHRNLISDVEGAIDPTRSGLREGRIGLSVLPFAHIMEHTNALSYLGAGLVHYVTTPERLIEDLRAVRPSYAAFVPRIFERLIAGIIGSARDAGGVKARLVPWAIRVGTAYERAIRDGGASPALRVQRGLARVLVLTRIRPSLGLDRVEYLISGSAPLHRDTALALQAMGLTILEGYGLTETSPVLTVNRPGDNTFGTVGPPVKGVELKIAADGEILARGPNVMLGYYHTTADQQPFTADGWLQTGDIGRIDAGGHLVITDRKKELYKTSGGKWISPSRIETAIKRSIYIGQLMAFGEGMPHPAVLVAPNWQLVRGKLHIPDDVPTAEVAADERVRALMIREIVHYTADLAPYERVHRVALLPRDLTIEDGELSPTLKVKRRVVEQRYAALIAAAYAEDLRARTAAGP